MESAADVYIKFIKHVGALIEHGITKLEGRKYMETGRLREHSENVINRLKSPSAKVAIAHAFSKLEPEIEDLLVGELEFIINNIQTTRDTKTGNLQYKSEFWDPEERSTTYNNANVEAADAHDADVASAAKTGKESLESILEKWIPGWLKNRLKILNEILSIVFKI